MVFSKGALFVPVLVVSLVAAATCFDRLPDSLHNILKRAVKHRAYSSAPFDQFAGEYANPKTQGVPMVQQAPKDNMLPSQKEYEYAMRQMSLPKALNQLLFGKDVVDIIELSNKMKEPRSEGSDEYACINKCVFKNLEPHSNSMNCSTFKTIQDCVPQCQQPNKVYASFIYNSLKNIENDVCNQNGNAEPFLQVLEKQLGECAMDMLNDTVKAVKMMRHAMGCYVELLEARDAKDACYVMKYCVIETSLAKVSDFCGDLTKNAVQLVKDSIVVTLTYVSDGHLVESCPSLYDH